MSFASKSHLAKGPVKGLFQKFKFFNIARPELYGGSYAKNLAAESPELIAAFFITVTGFGLIYNAYRQDLGLKHLTDRPYKRFYTVYRPDDPKIENLRQRPAYYNAEGTLPPYNKPVFELNKTQ